MNFNTKEVVVPDGASGGYKGINAGVHQVAIMDIEVYTAPSGSKVINLQVEDNNPVDDGYTYIGLLGEHKATNHVVSLAMGSWFKEVTDAVSDDIARNIASIANATGTREQVDAIVGVTSLEDYLVKVIAIIKGKYFYTIVQEREYLNSSNEVKVNKNIKAVKAGDNYIILAKPIEDFEITVIDGKQVLTNGSWKMDFNPEYDKKQVAKPDADPTVNNTSKGNSTDDLPF